MKELVPVFLLLLSNAGLAADYNVYCCATNPVAGDGTLASPWQKLSAIPWSVLQKTAAGGTNVYVNLQRGSTWRETLVIGGSGTPAHPITIQAYGAGARPRIDGGEALTNWSAFSSAVGSVWSCSDPVATSIGLVFRNQVVITNGADVAHLLDRQWCASSGTLFLRDDSGNPDTNGVSVYGLARGRPLDCRSQHDLRFTDVECWGGSDTGMYFSQATNIAVLRCRVEKCYQSVWFQYTSNVTFTASWFGQSVATGIHSTRANPALSFLFCVMSSGPSGYPNLSVDSANSSIDLINCTLVGSRAGHVYNNGSNALRLANCILSVPASSDHTSTGKEISNTGGAVTANYCLIQPNGQWPAYMVDGMTLGQGCIFTSPGFVSNASRGFLCIGLDDSGSFSAFTNLVRLADARGLKTHLNLDGVQDWTPMRSALQSAILNGHNILCHTMSHSLLTQSNAFTIQYTGRGSNATVAVSNGFLTTSVNGTNSSIALTDTIYALTTQLTHQPGFKVTPGEANVPSRCLADLPATSFLSPTTLQWDMLVKWTNEVVGWEEQARATWTNADGSAYDSAYIAYPSGSCNDALFLKLQQLGLRGGRTTYNAGICLRDFDMFEINTSPNFMGRGAELAFEMNVQDQNGTNNFAANNLTYTRDAFRGAYSGLFNGTSSFIVAAPSPVWDFSLGDWHVAIAAKPAGAGSEQTIFCSASDADNKMKVAIAADGSVFVSVYEGGLERLRLSTPPGLVTGDGRWHQIKVSETFDLWRIYIEDVVRAEIVSGVRCKAYTGNVFVGCELDWKTASKTNFFHGQLDDFSQSQCSYMNTQALMDTAAEAGFVYVSYSHGYITPPDTLERVLDAAAEYPGGSALVMAPVAAFEYIYAHSKVVSNRWVTLTNAGPPNYRLSSGSKARGAANPSVLTGYPDLEDMDGLPITDSAGNLLPGAALVSMGAYQPTGSVLSLNITYANGSLTLTWPADQPYWKLYTTGDLISSDPWFLVPNPPVLVGGYWTVTVPVTASGQQFFRLQAY